MEQTYTKPSVIISDGASEGVYAASGAGGASFAESGRCYQISVTPTGANGNEFSYQVYAQHVSSHALPGNPSQSVTISFDRPVSYAGCDGIESYSMGSSDASTIKIHVRYRENGDFSFNVIVTSDAPPSVTYAKVSD